MRDARSQPRHLSQGPDEQKAPAARQAQRARERGVDPLRAGEVVDPWLAFRRVLNRASDTAGVRHGE